MEMSCQPHVPVALPSEDEYSVPVEEEGERTPYKDWALWTTEPPACAGDHVSVGCNTVHPSPKWPGSGGPVLVSSSTAFLQGSCPQRDAFSYYLSHITRSATFSQPARTMIQETVCKAIPGTTPKGWLIYCRIPTGLAILHDNTPHTAATGHIGYRTPAIFKRLASVEPLWLSQNFRKNTIKQNCPFWV